MSGRLRAVGAALVATALAAVLGVALDPVDRASAGDAAAGDAFNWGRATETGDWERGESTANWREWADGTGRVAVMYGQLALDSGPVNFNGVATGDLATWREGSGHSRGRWELKVKLQQWNAIAARYKVRLELVPVGTLPGECGTTTITLARWTGHDATTLLGVRTGEKRWITSVSLDNANKFHTFAVELKDAVMVWFVDGKPVARLTAAKAPAAFTTLGLVPRMVLDTTPGTETTQSRLAADWIRYFTLERVGNPIPSTPPPTEGPAVSGLC